MKFEKDIKWLLEPENPSLKYRTLTDLLDTPVDDPEVKSTKEEIYEYKPVVDIFNKMYPDGYWLQKNPRTGEILGDGVEYGAFATTHYCLSYLAELGLDKNHPKIKKAANHYLNLQKIDGDFWNHFSCLIGLNIRTFIMLGFKNDIRVRKSINLLLESNRVDGGFLCDMHEGKYKTKPTKSCIRGSLKALLAFSYLPELWNHQTCHQLINYFLNRNGIFKTNNLSEYVNNDIKRLSFPITWKANIFEILLSLSKMGYGMNKRLDNAWKLLDSRCDSEGKFDLDWTPTQSPWKVGNRNQPNKWVTFYSYLAYKYKGK